MPALERYLHEVNNDLRHHHQQQQQQLNSNDVVADVNDDDRGCHKLDMRHNDGSSNLLHALTSNACLH